MDGAARRPHGRPGRLLGSQRRVGPDAAMARFDGSRKRIALAWRTLRGNGAVHFERALERGIRRAGARRCEKFRYFRLYMQRDRTMNASSLIAGKAVAGAGFVVVRSPHHGAEAGRVAAASREDVAAAVAAASSFRDTPTRYERSRILDLT